MRSLVVFLRALVGLQDLERLRSTPRDAREFDEAKKRLRYSSRAFAKELSQFGDLVKGMRVPSKPPAKKKPKTKRTRKKAAKR